MNASPPAFTTLAVSLAEGIATIRLDRPDKANAIDDAMWQELRTAFRWADATPAVRVAVLAGAGRHFCAGIDLAMLAGIGPRIARRDAARGREALRRVILDLQDCVNAIERCRKPVLAAIQGACIGGAVDIACCCDMRYAAADARFAVREIDVGMAADLGTLQRLPRLVPPGVAHELCYTGREFDAAEALRLGFVNRVFDTPELLAAGVVDVARTIAAKSPLAIRGIKENLLHARDRPLADALDHVATWNAAMLQSDDLAEALAAQRERRPPRFAD